MGFFINAKTDSSGEIQDKIKVIGLKYLIHLAVYSQNILVRINLVV